MYSEFCCEDQIYDNANPFETGLDVLKEFEIEDVDRGADVSSIGLLRHDLFFRIKCKC